MRLPLLLLALVSAPAFSCPNLQGLYTICRTNNAEGSSVSELHITQNVVNKQMQYIFTSKEVGPDNTRVDKYLADGKVKRTKETDPDTGISITTATTTSCSGETLVIKTLAHIDSEEFANLTIHSNKTGNQFTQIFTGTSMGMPVNETIICE